MNKCLDLLAIDLVDLNDLSALSSNQHGLGLLEVVERANAGGKAGHRSHVNDLLLHELSIPEDQLALVAAGDNQQAIVDGDNLPESLGVCLDRFA